MQAKENLGRYTSVTQVGRVVIWSSIFWGDDVMASVGPPVTLIGRGVMKSCRERGGEGGREGGREEEGEVHDGVVE